MQANTGSDLPLGTPDSPTNAALDAEAQALAFLADDDADLSFIDDLLSPDTDVPQSSPFASSLILKSSASAQSSEEFDLMRGSERKRKMISPPESEEGDEQADKRDERRNKKSAKNARYRSRKKNELVLLREQASRFEEQLNTLRLTHKTLRADSLVACWEEKAITQRRKRRHAQEINEQLQQALFVHSGFVRNLKSVFTESTPPSMALNMQHFLHMYTHLQKDPQLRLRDLEAVGTHAKLDRAMQVVLRETSTIPVSTSPEILFQELDLGSENLGKTSTAVYAFNTTDATKAFAVACKAILTTCGVWPDHSRLESSMKFVDTPPTKHNVRYGITCHRYQHNSTKVQAWTEARDLYYSRMVGSCGVLVWDFVDADDLYPLKCNTLIKRDTVGALVLRPEVCSDGAERMVCRIICSDMQISINAPKPALKVREFALLEDMMVYEAIKEGATDWQDTAV